MQKSFTLLEIIVTVVILGILVAIGLPKFFKTTETAHDKEAIALLKLIQQSEEVYQLERKSYTTCIDNAACNTSLGLALPTGTAAYWDYSVPQADKNDFCAQAYHTGKHTTRYFNLSQGESQAQSGKCP